MKAIITSLAVAAVLAVPVLTASPAQATWDMPRWAGGERDVSVGVTTRYAHYDRRRVVRRGPAVRFGVDIGPRYYVPRRTYSRYYYNPYPYGYRYYSYPYHNYGYYPRRGGVSLHFGF